MFLIFSSSFLSTVSLAFALSSGDGVYGLSLSPSDGFDGVDGWSEVGVSFSTSFLPFSLAFSTSSLEGALSIVFLASSASFLAFSLAFSFCSGVKLGSPSIFFTLFSRALSISSLAFGLSSGVTGVFSTSSLPFVVDFSTSSGVFASSNAFLACSADFLASSIAFSFSSFVNSGFSLILLSFSDKDLSISLEASSLMSL